MPKTIVLTVPDNAVIPEVLHEFTPEKVFLAINIGCKCIINAEQSMLGLTQESIYNKAKEETAEQINKLEMNLVIEREMSKKMDERTKNIYEIQIENYKKQLDKLSYQLKSYELENKDLINDAVKKEKEKYDYLLDSQEKRIEKMQETNDQIKETLIKLTHKSTSHKGSAGENEFKIYAVETFMDFSGYKLFDKHSQGGAGDFHLWFDKFNVLVDAKNYKTSVPIGQREKIKNDLEKNSHITFAWLVSLNTTIDKYEKAPVMYEWINTKQCIVYINNLSQYEEPRKILRIVWYTCKELYKLVENVSTDDFELTNLKERQFKFMDKVKNIRKTIREINTTINSTRNLLLVVDDQLKEILDEETEKIVESNYSLFDDWWDLNITLTDENVKILSTDLWTKFKQDNKLLINDFEITTEKFKQYIKTKVSMANIILKNKNVNSAFEIKGIKWNNKETIIESNKLDVFVDEVLSEKKKIVKKIKLDTHYFSEDLDKKIIEDYVDNNDSIIEISKNNKIETYKIVSLLVRNKIISKRSDARGYDEYKETDEYKNKINK